MKSKDEQLIFSSGRILHPNRGIVGLSPDLEIYEGYDDSLGDQFDPLTKDEQIELADHMIQRWTEYKTDGENNGKA